MNKDELWSAYEKALKTQDELRRDKRHLDSDVLALHLKTTKHNQTVSNIEDVMRAVATGYDFKEVLENMCIGNDFCQQSN